MARLEKNTYPPLRISDVQDSIVFVVDMVNGFIKEGALHDEAIMSVAFNIQKLLSTLSCRCVFVADHHPPQTREFLSYPPHCVMDTSESEVIDELQPYIQTLLYKNSTNTFVSPDFQAFLPEIDAYKDIIITGCCTDLCILQFALSLNSWLNEQNKMDHRILLPVDCVETYHMPDVHDAKSWNAFALENMAANGIYCVSQIME